MKYRKWLKADSFEGMASLGGSEYFDVGAKPRGHRLTFPALTKTEAYGRLVDMQNLLGISGEILIDPDYADTENKPRIAFVARFVSLSDVVNEGNGRYSSSMQLREVF